MTQWNDDVNNFMLYCRVGLERCVSSCASFADDLAQKPCLLYFSAWVIAMKCSLKIIAPPLEGAAMCPSVIAWPALTWRTEEDDGRVTADWGMTSHKIESPKCLQALCSRLTIQKTEFSSSWILLSWSLSLMTLLTILFHSKGKVDLITILGEIWYHFTELVGDV